MHRGTMKKRLIGLVIPALAALLPAGGVAAAGPEQGAPCEKPPPCVYTLSRHSPDPPKTPPPDAPPPAAHEEQPAPETPKVPPESPEPEKHPAPEPPPLPPSAIPQQPPSPEPPSGTKEPTQPAEIARTGPSTLAGRALARKYGERFEKLLEPLNAWVQSPEGDHGMSSPSASWRFDGAPLGTGIDDVLAPGANTPYFHGGTTSISEPSMGTVYVPISVSGAREISAIGSIPGGIVLEGAAAGLGPIGSLTYDAKFNAFVLDDRAVYFVKVPPRTIAVMCRAIAADDRIGVSLGDIHIVYGKLPPDSDIALDLLLADKFLGDIAFAGKDWTAGYRFAKGYEPRRSQVGFRGAAFFRFSGFKFAIVGEEIRLVDESFNDSLIPILETKAQDGGALADEEAIEQGSLPPEYVMNLRHIADNMKYYRHERIIDEVFSYGEVAAFLRGLKEAGVDLNEVAAGIDREFEDE